MIFSSQHLTIGISFSSHLSGPPFHLVCHSRALSNGPVFSPDSPSQSDGFKNTPTLWPPVAVQPLGSSYSGHPTMSGVCTLRARPLVPISREPSLPSDICVLCSLCVQPRADSLTAAAAVLGGLSLKPVHKCWPALAHHQSRCPCASEIWCCAWCHLPEGRVLWALFE